MPLSSTSIRFVVIFLPYILNETASRRARTHARFISTSSDIMSTTFILIVLFAFAQFFGVASPICSVSRYPEGFGNWVKCSNATIDEATRRGSSGGTIIAAITISQSRIPNIPENSFASYGRSLESLNLHYCGIRTIHRNGFASLTYLKKLNLANNNITTVEPGWFSSLSSLEQLDMSFNSIERMDSAIFSKLTNLRRFNLDDNRLTCLEPQNMEVMRSLVKIRLTGNPLSLACRAKVTLWLSDKGINYLDGLQQRSDSKATTWLDRVLWLCAEDVNEAETDDVGSDVGEDRVSGMSRIEIRMRQCLLLNLFNQLRLALKTSESYATSGQRCNRESKMLTSCVSRSGRRGPGKITNGEAATNFIMALRSAQEKIQLNH